jgi:DNA processing protein
VDRSERRPPGSGGSRDARAVCAWLGLLAAWRPGLLKGLLRCYGGLAAAAERPPREIAAFAAEWAAQRAPNRRHVATAGDAAADATGFVTALQEGPLRGLRRLERRPPGDLVITWPDALYPDQLRDLSDPPPCLFVRGEPVALRARLAALVEVPLVAVVGTRAPSPYGEDMARAVAADLTRAGVAVVSGLALGIDSVAQDAAVEAARTLRARLPGAEAPATVAVLGCGADVVYPRTNEALYARVLRHGLLVSEYPWGIPVRKWRFPARNRLMAALSRAVVIVEGTASSGAVITADFAADLGRDVLCVPGEAGRRLSAAPNQLLRDGAHVCEGAADVLRAIAVDDPGGAPDDSVGAPPSPSPALVLDHGGAAIRDVLAQLGAATLTIDELAARCDLTVAKASAAVSDLEIEGLVRRADGGRYRVLAGSRAAAGRKERLRR